MSESVILTDSDDASIRDAAALLDSWTVVVRPARELASALGETAAVRVVVTTTDIHSPQRIAEALKHAYDGDFKLSYGHDEYTVRVNWQR